MIATLLPILVSVLTEAPQVIDSVKKIWALASQNTAPTQEEQNSFDAALEAAHKAVQDM